MPTVPTVMQPLTIDLRWQDQPESIACYVLNTDSGVVLIDPGPASTTERLRQQLAENGIDERDVRHVVLTHIHLDHAGSAWWWTRNGGTAAQRPTVDVHRFGATHMIDPSRLLASAQRIYGEQMEPMWGTLEPIDEARVQPVDDGDVIDLGEVSLRAIGTPGHAKHHHAYALEGDAAEKRICFTGDAAAMTVTGSAFISLPTPPPEFDLQHWLASVQRLKDESFNAIYPTHFGRVDDVHQHLDRVAAALRSHVGFVRKCIENQPRRRDEVIEQYRNWLTERAEAAGLDNRQIRRHITDSLVRMNVSGIARYLEQQKDQHQQVGE